MKGFYLQREKSGAQAFVNDTLEQESDNILKLLARFTSQTVIVQIMMGISTSVATMSQKTDKDLKTK